MSEAVEDSTNLGPSHNENEESIILEGITTTGGETGGDGSTDLVDSNNDSKEEEGLPFDGNLKTSSPAPSLAKVTAPVVSASASSSSTTSTTTSTIGRALPAQRPAVIAGTLEDLVIRLTRCARKLQLQDDVGAEKSKTEETLDSAVALIESAVEIHMGQREVLHSQLAKLQGIVTRGRENIYSDILQELTEVNERYIKLLDEHEVNERKLVEQKDALQDAIERRQEYKSRWKKAELANENMYALLLREGAANAPNKDERSKHRLELLEHLKASAHWWEDLRADLHKETEF